MKIRENISEKKLNAKNKIRYLSIFYHWFDVPQSEASENSHYFQNWHILLYSVHASVCLPVIPVISSTDDICLHGFDDMAPR